MFSARRKVFTARRKVFTARRRRYAIAIYAFFVGGRVQQKLSDDRTPSPPHAKKPHISEVPAHLPKSKGLPLRFPKILNTTTIMLTSEYVFGGYPQDSN